jgi:hypothetical protein
LQAGKAVDEKKHGDSKCYGIGNLVCRTSYGSSFLKFALAFTTSSISLSHLSHPPELFQNAINYRPFVHGCFCNSNVHCFEGQSIRRRVD